MIKRPFVQVQAMTAKSALCQFVHGAANDRNFPSSPLVLHNAQICTFGPVGPTRALQPCGAQTRERCESGDATRQRACFAIQNAAIRNYYVLAKDVLPQTIEGIDLSVRLYQSNLSDMEDVFAAPQLRCIPGLDLGVEHCGFVVFVMEFVDLIGAAVDANVDLP